MLDEGNPCQAHPLPANRPAGDQPSSRLLSLSFGYVTQCGPVFGRVVHSYEWSDCKLQYHCFRDRYVLAPWSQVLHRTARPTRNIVAQAVHRLGTSFWKARSSIWLRAYHDTWKYGWLRSASQLTTAAPIGLRQGRTINHVDHSNQGIFGAKRTSRPESKASPQPRLCCSPRLCTPNSLHGYRRVM